MIEVSEKYLACGQSNFIKEVAIPVGDIIQEIALEYPCTNEADPVAITPRATAFLTGLDALIGISVFLGGWAGTKFLDEIYDAKLGPAVKGYLRPYIESYLQFKVGLTI